ncbi:hybrid sensor histidine kinase/response regulator [Noviherbaspirillum sp. ST9]|uniref:hybrid sensor histidine kinase/response regulator n=1 Tax=Noviherbaspirillum sp. ST9 TaxID=3401606 RepID=UPI003B588EB2
MTSEELRDHASTMLNAIAAELCRPQTAQEQADKSKGHANPGCTGAAGGKHGSARLRSNFTIEQLLAEYRALRASVLRLWSKGAEASSQCDLKDISRFNEAIDQLLAASVRSFAQESRSALHFEQTCRDEFLAMLAHELRNPLAPITSATALLKWGKTDETVTRRATAIIERQVEHMAGLIDDLLDVSRLTGGLIELQVEVLNLRGIILDATEQALPLIQARGHQLTTEESPDIAVVRGDRKRLVQIVSNLLTNAAKYTPAGGRIVLRTDVSQEQVIVTVRDNGVGMTPDLIEHLFEPFVQAKRTSDRSSGGLGLGLTLVKSLVDLHNGKVTCTSAGPGKGSEFSIYLPRLPNWDEKPEPDARSRVPAPSAKRVKVLIVDDNVDAAQALFIVLTAAGHEVSVEHCPRRALETALKDIPDVYLLDIGLPQMDGNEVARLLRARPETSSAILIAVTGYGQLDDREKALAAGFDHYMTKPVDLSRLLTLLASV